MPELLCLPVGFVLGAYGTLIDADGGYLRALVVALAFVGVRLILLEWHGG